MPETGIGVGTDQIIQILWTIFMSEGNTILQIAYKIPEKQWILRKFSDKKWDLHHMLMVFKNDVSLDQARAKSKQICSKRSIAE